MKKLCFLFHITINLIFRSILAADTRRLFRVFGRHVREPGRHFSISVEKSYTDHDTAKPNSLWDWMLSPPGIKRDPISLRSTGLSKHTFRDESAVQLLATSGLLAASE